MLQSLMVFGLLVSGAVRSTAPSAIPKMNSSGNKVKSSRASDCICRSELVSGAKMAGGRGTLASLSKSSSMNLPVGEKSCSSLNGQVQGEEMIGRKKQKVTRDRRCFKRISPDDPRMAKIRAASKAKGRALKPSEVKEVLKGAKLGSF